MLNRNLLVFSALLPLTLAIAAAVTPAPAAKAAATLSLSPARTAAPDRRVRTKLGDTLSRLQKLVSSPSMLASRHFGGPKRTVED